jgi:hypothetical protein
MVSEKTKEIMRAAGLQAELTFTSFRHGGFTESPLIRLNVQDGGGLSHP